ncbi:MAG: acryloyl-CoA reductase [Chromatiaceae bacterium]|nr:MAG: acryloyl-CoA reductase [Chromatiaceae bacterium]
MPDTPAFRIYRDDNGHRTELTRVPTPMPAPGEVLVRVLYSGINYKDALAGTGRGKVVKTFPITGGIDAAGIVETSNHPGFSPGDPVIATGWGLGFDHDGGYAGYLCVPGDWLQSLPAELDLRAAMILGTAGITAAFAVQRMLDNGQQPELGPLLITGASGGVGCIAVAILARLGFEVVAMSGKPDLHDWLRSLGASDVLGRNDLAVEERPLGPARWGGAIDNVGGELLGTLTRTIVPAGNIASVGLAGGITVNTTVMPFILRGINLLGINSVDIPNPIRAQLWQHLADDWQPARMADILTAIVSLEALPELFEQMLLGRTHGRMLVTLEDANA